METAQERSVTCAACPRSGGAACVRQASPAVASRSRDKETERVWTPGGAAEFVRGALRAGSWPPRAEARGRLLFAFPLRSVLRPKAVWAAPSGLGPPSRTHPGSLWVSVAGAPRCGNGNMSLRGCLPLSRAPTMSCVDQVHVLSGIFETQAPPVLPWS